MPKKLAMHAMPNVSRRTVLLFAVSFAVIGVITLVISKAATSNYSIEPETSNVSVGAVTGTDSAASGGSYVTFKAPHMDMTHIPADQLPKGNPEYADSRILLYSNAIPELSGDGTGNFRVGCEFSHMSYDDPIVYPGQQGAAHLHTFFGNTSTNYSSTHASLITTGNKSTCAGAAANLSAYWVPTLMNGSTPLAPQSQGAYYKSEHLPANTIQDVPKGLIMVAGNKNSLVGQNPWMIYWNCIGGSNGTTIPSCPAGSTLGLSVAFPQCWDGVNLDSPDHISHVRYSGLFPQPPGTVGTFGDDCTKEVGHHVHIPAITVITNWIVPPGGSANLRLSSDLPGAAPGASAHADYMEGWDRPILQRFMQHCVREARDTTNNLCDGQELVLPNQFRFN
jgi:hypothetical protein